MTHDTPTFQDEPGTPRAPLGFGRAPAPDPVDAAIERHRAAREELQRASSGVDAAMTASKRAEVEADAVFAAASNADGEAWADLLATRPGDVPGAVRLLRYVSGSPASEVVEDPQDLLRQLLAAVEAGETGGPAGEGALVGAEPQAVAEPDPALAVVAEYRAAWDGLGEQVKTSWIGAAAEAADDAEAAAYARLRTVRPTTPAGFRALAETWAWRLAMTRNGAEADTVADNAADALIASAGVCVPPASPADGNDAVHGLIQAHQEAYAAWSVASKGWTEAEPDAADYAAQQAAADERGAEELRAFQRLFSARPTTLAGTAALASYLGEAIRQTRVDADPTEGERALSTIAAALYGIGPGGAFSGDAPATVSSPLADAALLALGEDFMAAWVEEARAGTAEAYHAVNAVAERIARTPAETPAGYGIKALLLARLFGEGSSPLSPEAIPPHGPVYSVWRMLRQVQQGAARLAGLPDAEPVAADDFERLRTASPEHDLAGLPVEQLGHLYDALLPFEDLIGRAENAPCFWEGEGLRTVAGDIIYGEAARLEGILKTIAKEIESRVPANDSEREIRLVTLLRHRMLGGGLPTSRALLTEALAACED